MIAIIFYIVIATAFAVVIAYRYWRSKIKRKVFMLFFSKDRRITKGSAIPDNQGVLQYNDRAYIYRSEYVFFLSLIHI